MGIQQRKKQGGPAYACDNEWRAHLESYGDVEEPRVDVKQGFEVLNGGLAIKPAHGDTCLVSIPVVRHWLFAPDRTKERVRIFSVTTKHQGRSLVQKFQIGDIHAGQAQGYGVLTTKHQRAILALQCIWQEHGAQMASVNGSRKGYLEVSSWELEQSLFRAHGGQQSRLVRKVIQELASIPVKITNYIGPGGGVFDVDMTGLLAGAEFFQSAGRTGGPWVKIVLGDIVTRAFEEESSTKPLDFGVVRDLRGDLPALLYPKLDYYLVARADVAFTLTTLANNLGLVGESKRQSARQVRLFQKVAGELDGKPLSGRGRVLKTSVEIRDGGRDHLFIAKR